jgi:hypothetical protein
MKEFFVYKTTEGFSGLIRTSEVARICEFTQDGAILRIFMKDGTVIESISYDLIGFSTGVLEDDVIEELLQAA